MKKLNTDMLKPPVGATNGHALTVEGGKIVPKPVGVDLEAILNKLAELEARIVVLESAP